MNISMNVQAKKLEIVQLILNTEKPTLLRMVEDVLKREKVADWWDEISPAERKTIERGIEEADRGELIPHEQVMKEVRAKYHL